MHRVEDAVTVHSMGGLGNQLFIYGAGLAAARTSGARLRVDVGQHEERPDRPPLLESLGLPAEYVDLGRRAWPARLPGRALRLWSGRHDAPWGCTYRERGFPYDANALAQAPGSCLFGYFQSWRYLEPVAEELRDLLGVLADERSTHLDAVGNPLKADDCVVVHVRRGDYLHAGASAFHGVAGLRYYRDALTTLRAMGFGGPAYVFSDDPAAARAELTEIDGLVPVTEEPLDALSEMLLMSRAPALVTANSSFSWWAAWLGDRPDRPVVSPRPWFDDPGVDARDLLPPHWLTLDRRDF